MSEAVAVHQPFEGFAKKDNVTTHFRAMGQGPLMVLIHGFPDNSGTYELQMHEFSKCFTVVCPTLRGYPPSDIPEDPEAYHLHVVANDFLAILDYFNANKAIVGGHDFGGAAIQFLALMHPERVSGLILMNTPILPNFSDLVNFDTDQQKLSEYTIDYINYQHGDDKNEKFIVRTIRDENYREAIRKYLTVSPVTGMFNYYKKNYPAPPYGKESDLPQIQYRIPTLIIWGTEDEYFSRKMLNDLSEYFTETTRVVLMPGAGHWVFRDRPERVNREIWSWLTLLNMDTVADI